MYTFAIKVNKAERVKVLKLIRKWTEQDYIDGFEDDEYPADHESWTGKWCDGCKSYMIKGKWVGCEDCDK